VKPQPKLPPEEWNFQEVHPRCIPDAIVWEYARESAPMKAAIEELLDGRLDGYTVRELIQGGVMSDKLPHRKRAAKIGLEITRRFQARIGHEDLLEILYEFGDLFPKPWLTVQKHVEISDDKEHERFKQFQLFSAVSIQPMSKAIERSRQI